MLIENEFELSVPVADAWPLLLDIPFVAPCLPGTSLSRVVDDTTYEGKVALRLGPVQLTFAGTAEIVGVDAAASAVAVRASGREERGRGTAHADVVFRLAPSGKGTKVLIATDLTLAGSIVQYARGTQIVSRTAQALVDQFAARLQARLDGGGEPDHAAIRVGSLLWQGLRGGVGPR